MDTVNEKKDIYDLLIEFDRGEILLVSSPLNYVSDALPRKILVSPNYHAEDFYIFAVLPHTPGITPAPFNIIYFIRIFFFSLIE